MDQRRRRKTSKINNQNENKTNQKSTAQSRSARKRKERQRKFRRRRIILILILLVILFIVFRFISNALNTYKVTGYPDFRDEVLDTIGDEVFVSPGEGRSLSTAEKVTDFDNLYKIIERNYAIDQLNKEDFLEFINQYNDYRKKVYTSKTDQEYFDLINKYLEVLDDTRTFILDKDSYDSLFNYYRNQKDGARKEALENPQAVNRYNRLIRDQAKTKPSMTLNIEANNILRISLPDFKADEFDKDLKTLIDLLVSNPPMTTFILDLRDNNSIDTVYRNKLAEILLSNDYSESNNIFYRSNIFENTLKNIKESDDNYYSTMNVKNDASKNSEELSSIDKDNYLYYDELELKIKENPDFSDRSIYVLTNAETANEAIKLADILQKNGAYIVKNALDSNPTYKDVIYNAPSDLVVLEHSGLILSLNSAYSKNEADKYLNYNEKINSRDPIQTIKNMKN